MARTDTLFTLVVAVAIVALFVGVILLPEPHSDLPLLTGENLGAGPYTFYVSEDAGTLVGAFRNDNGMLFALVTTFPNYTVHTTPPAQFCGGSFNLTLPRGQYYVYFLLDGAFVTRSTRPCPTADTDGWNTKD